MCNQAVDPHFIFSGACEQLTEPIHPSRQNRHGSSPLLRAMIAVRASEEKCNHRKSAHRCGSVNSSPFTTLRSGECSLISASATGSPSGDDAVLSAPVRQVPRQGMKREVGWNARAAPATVSGERSSPRAIGTKGFEKAAGKRRPVSQETCLTRSFFGRTGCAGRTGISSPSDSHRLAGAAVHGSSVACPMPASPLPRGSRQGICRRGWRK